MNYWKINNISKHTVKFVVTISSQNSIGVQVEPGQFVLSVIKTPHIDAQWRRKLVSIENNFDNSVYQLEIGKPYDESVLEDLKMQQAKKNAGEYMKK